MTRSSQEPRSTTPTIDLHERPELGPPAALLRRVGRFVLLERLGAGGMGVVYAAYDEQLERKVAIKLLAHREDDRGHERLLREAQAQARLAHPNVVTVHEVGTLPEGDLFIVMELVKGETLRTWQQREPQGWRDVVAMYAAAGEGLAAAHRAGLVHRDFKPENVILGDDGRVRVADFGIAYAAGADPAAAAPAAAAPAAEPAEPAEPAAAAPAATEPPRRTRTTTGGVAGTPGYMAPEQLAGAEVDARTDQFGFCVALYEALHGERPFADLAFAHGARPAPRRTEPDPDQPRWLWDLVMRGLALDRDQRFASMDALLAELTRNRARTRRRVAMIAALAAAIAIAVGATALTARTRVPPCQPATEDLAGIWDAASRRQIEAALLGTGAPYATAVWTSTAAAFERYAGRWLGAQQAACEATHVRHVQSAALLDRRMECLAGRRRSFAAATEVLRSRPVQAIEHAGELLSSLGDIEPCGDTGVLLELGAGRGAARPAAGVADRAQVQAAEVRRQLAHADALLAAGEVASAEPVVAAASRLAADLDEAVRAEVLYFEGRTKLARDEVAASLVSFNRAIELAVSSRHDELPAEIWLTLAVSAGKLEQRPAEIEAWLGQGEAWIRRLGHASDSRRVEVEHARGGLQLTAGNAREAVAALTRALAAAEALWGGNNPRLVSLLRDRATANGRLQQAKAAVADGERALAIGLAAWGPEYRDIASTRRTLGLLYIEQLGDVARGERELTQALEVYRARFGADSTEVANTEQALSQAGLYRGDYAAALDHAERAERIFTARRGPDHPRRGEALMGVGVLRFMRGDFVGSLAAYEAAYAVLRAALGAEHVTVGLLLSNIGETELALERAEPARGHFEQALAILTRSLGPEHADLALPLKGLGLADLRRGRPRDAQEPLERALALRTASSAASEPQELAETRWALARALGASSGEPARTRALAEAAEAGYRGLGGESIARADEIRRWLAARRP